MISTEFGCQKPIQPPGIAGTLQTHQPCGGKVQQLLFGTKQQHRDEFAQLRKVPDDRQIPLPAFQLFYQRWQRIIGIQTAARVHPLFDLQAGGKDVCGLLGPGFTAVPDLLYLRADPGKNAA